MIQHLVNEIKPILLNNRNTQVVFLQYIHHQHRLMFQQINQILKINQFRIELKIVLINVKMVVLFDIIYIHIYSI